MNKLVVILALYLTGNWSFLNQELDQYSSLHALQVPLLFWPKALQEPWRNSKEIPTSSTRIQECVEKRIVSANTGFIRNISL